VTRQLLDQENALVQAAPDFIGFFRMHSLQWFAGMCERQGLPAPPQETCMALAEHAIVSTARRIRAALPGAIEAIHALHRRGHQLFTASGAFSREVEGYLEGMGVRGCFDRCYGANLINIFKDGPTYYERLFMDLGIRPAEALVVDDNCAAINWAAQTG